MNIGVTDMSEEVSADVCLGTDIVTKKTVITLDFGRLSFDRQADLDRRRDTELDMADEDLLESDSY